MNIQHISAISKEFCGQECHRLSEDQWVSCLFNFLASDPFNIWSDKCARQVFTEYLLLKPDS